MLTEDQIDYSILATIGKAISWIFAPLGWGNWQGNSCINYRSCC